MMPSLLFFLTCLSPFISLHAVQLMFGRFGQVVEKKKSITLQDISAVRRQIFSFLSFFFCISTCRFCPYDELTLPLASPRRRSAGSCPACWAARSPPCSVYQWPAGLPVRWWRWRAPSTSRVGRGTYSVPGYVKECFPNHSQPLHGEQSF